MQVGVNHFRSSIRFSMWRLGDVTDSGPDAVGIAACLSRPRGRMLILRPPGSNFESHYQRAVSSDSSH